MNAVKITICIKINKNKKKIIILDACLKTTPNDVTNWVSQFHDYFFNKRGNNAVTGLYKPNIMFVATEINYKSNTYIHIIYIYLLRFSFIFN